MALGDVDETTAEREPWSLWATVGLGFAVLAIFVVVQTLVTAGFAAAAFRSGASTDIAVLGESLKTNGLLLAVATCATAVVCSGMLVLLVSLRRGWSAREYLALKPVPWSTAGIWLLFLLMYAVASDSLTSALGRPIVPDFMIKTYSTAGCVPLLWFAFVAAAPIFEELFFRGFLFRGFQHSSLGNLGAVVVTSLVWTVMHLQYGAYELALVFAGGLLIGTARWKTGSVYTTIAMHILMNLIATMEVAVYLGR